MFHDFPYTDYHEQNLDWLLCMCKRSMGLRLDVQGDYLRLVNAKNEVISSVQVSYSDKALTDVDGNPIKAYILNAGTNGDYVVFTKGNGETITLTIPFANKAKYDIDNHEITDYVYNVQLAGDKVRVTKGDGTIAEFTIPYAIRASNDNEGNDLTTYACTLAVDGDTLVLRDRKGRLLNSVIVPYATKALNDVDSDAIKSTYGNKIQAGTTTVKMLAKDGTVLSEITVPYATEASHAVNADHATLADDATNAIETVQVIGDKMVFTTYGGVQTEITCPYAIKAQKDDLGNVIKNTYIANVTCDNATGEITFYDATGNDIVTIIPTVNKATHDSYNNLIADYIKQIVVSSSSNYVTVVHGTGDTDSIIIHYSETAWKDTNDNVIKNTYITSMECIEDVEDGHYKLVCYDGDTPKAELFRIELLAYSAQTDINGRELTTYVGNVVVDEDDDKYIDVLDGEGNAKNVIAGSVTTTPTGSISATASGTAVALTSGTLPSITYNSGTETLTFNAGAFPTVSGVTDPSISATFTGDAGTEDVHFADTPTP